MPVSDHRALRCQPQDCKTAADGLRIQQRPRLACAGCCQSPGACERRLCVIIQGTAPGTQGWRPGSELAQRLGRLDLARWGWCQWARRASAGLGRDVLHPRPRCHVRPGGQGFSLVLLHNPHACAQSRWGFCSLRPGARHRGRRQERALSPERSSAREACVRQSGQRAFHSSVPSTAAALLSACS